MFCSRCGAPNPDWAPACAACAAPLAAAFMPPMARPAPVGLKGSTYLIFAILSTVFCCMPLGIVAVVFASQIDGKVASGDIVGAEASARQAKGWTIASAAGWAVVVIAYAGIFATAFFLDRK